jgi:hypothetical protein
MRRLAAPDHHGMALGQALFLGGRSSGPVDPYAAYILYDTASGELDETPLTSHAPEKDLLGGGWQLQNGNSQKIVGGVIVGNDGETAIDIGLARIFKLSYRGRRAGGFGNAMNFIYTDSNNYAVAVMFPGTFSLYTVVGGVASETSGGAGEPDPNLWHDLRIEVDAVGVAHLFVDDVDVVNRDCSGVPLSTLVGPSSKAAHANNGNEFDDIVVQAL